MAELKRDRELQNGQGQGKAAEGLLAETRLGSRGSSFSTEMSIRLLTVFLSL